MSTVLRPYRLFLAVPSAPALLFTSLLGRLSVPAIPLVMTFLIVDWTGSYATGGVLGGVLGVGQGIAGPVRGRAADHRSATSILVVTSIGFSAGLTVLALLASPIGLAPSLWWVLVPIALVTGLFASPISQMNRSLWPRIAHGPAREAAYSVDATVQELLFVVGPMLAAFAVARMGSVNAMLWTAAVSLVGPMIYWFVLWRAGMCRALIGTAQAAGQRAGSLFATRGFVLLLVILLLLVAGVVAIDLMLVGWARNRGTPELAGLLTACWAFGSFLGGFAMGAVVGRPRLWLRMAWIAVGLLVLAWVLPPVADPAIPALVCVVLLFASGAIAPALAASNGVLVDVVPESRRTEAFGWGMSASTVGVTLASPVTGWLLDVGGPAWAAALAAILLLIGAGVALHPAVRTARPVEVTTCAA